MIEVNAKNGRTVSRAANSEMEDEAIGGLAFESPQLRAWRASPVSELNCGPTKGRLSTALMGVAWIHLFCFLGCQAVYDPAIITDFRHPLLWIVELGGVLAALRAVLGRGWMRSSHAVNLVAKFWISFLIVSFNAVSLNSFTGFKLTLVQASLGDALNVPVRHAGVAVYPTLFHPCRSDVVDGPFDDLVADLELPDLWRLMVAGTHGYRGLAAAPGTELDASGCYLAELVGDPEKRWDIRLASGSAIGCPPSDREFANPRSAQLRTRPGT